MNETQAQAVHAMDQGMAALGSLTGAALAVLRGAVEAGATPVETATLLGSFWRSVMGFPADG